MRKTMTIAVDVPAYCTVDVPESVAETPEALAAFANSVINSWQFGEQDDEGEVVYDFEPFYEGADAPRILECLESQVGKPARMICEAINLCPPADDLSIVVGAKRAIADGLIVEAYLLASTAHLSLKERVLCDGGHFLNMQLVISMTSRYGSMLHLNEILLNRPAPQAGRDARVVELAPLFEGLSEGLIGVIHKAIEYGLPYIRFDADGPIIGGIPTYDDQPEEDGDQTSG